MKKLFGFYLYNTDDQIPVHTYKFSYENLIVVSAKSSLKSS